MTFAIEALGLTSGGGKTGLIKLLPALADRGRGHKFVAIVADLADFRGLERPNLKLVRRKKPASLWRRHFHLQATVPGICAQQRADALLCLGNFGPASPALPTVVLLHNAQYVCAEAPAGAAATVRERMIAWYGRRYLRRLDGQVRVVVQTQLMQRRLVEGEGIAASRVFVIPDSDGLPAEGIALEAEAGQRLSSPKCLGRVGAGRAARYERSLPAARAHAASACAPPFTFFCLAYYYPHKNLEVLLEAMKRLRAYARRPAQCLITIHPDQHPGARKLLRAIERERLDQAVVNLGPLEGHEVVQAYRSADAFILPSLLESFGRTYLEAIRSDLPILTSDRDFAHEVCGGAALYFDPLDPDSVARSMARIMTDSALRDRLAAERRRIPIPSWDEVADRFLRVLEDMAAERQTCAFADSAPVVTADVCDS